MKQVAVFFVPAGATQRDFEAALREHFTDAAIGEAAPGIEADSSKFHVPDELPLWTWFIPNSRNQ